MSVEEVREQLERFGAGERIRTFPVSTASVAAAAEALGVPPDRIAKTLAVRVKGAGEVFVLVLPGGARVDNARFRAEFGGKPQFVGREDCLAATGHPPGGVSPLGLKPGVKVYLDRSLTAYSEVYPAAGEPNNCIVLTPEELFEWSGGSWVAVAAPSGSQEMETPG
ncbi:MAG: YbaK/EbsC family protein [Planctomycetota bacterium]|jgi:prolyl-tRNA editing enzyme YbaK/EbsC (Cys-tRNA(Pro) deacylase)|nr:YbaK/EbsC family protein [Planctomycetota bacterium]